ncbi:hypothetical protein MVEN_01181700 [Mycena venus]|uniref:BTB domain-containing protein n=1 Tax=Mycena venus TaxID=2733690 RepID=A0A8H6Y184_9AGAR|nr:hypothetical protein MVEN_01181700 [Mycena venus]
MSEAVSPSESQDTVSQMLTTVAANTEPPSPAEDNSEFRLVGPSSSATVHQDAAGDPADPLASSDGTSPATPVTTSSTIHSEADQDAGTETTSGSYPGNPQVSFGSAFPQLSPPLEPVKDRYVEDVRPLSDDEEDDLPILENLLAETRPDYIQVPPRLSQMPRIKTEETVSNIKLQSHGAREHVVIDLTGSSPSPQPPKTQQPSESPSVPQPTASPARTRRKHTPSVLPSDLGSPPAKRSKTASTVTLARKHEVHWALDGNVVIQIQDTNPWFSGLFDDEKVTGGEHVEESEDGSTPMYILSLPTLTAKDFTRLLDAFDHAIIYVHEDPSFSRIAGILRAATLLSFPDYRDWAIRLLEDRWSPALADLSPERILHATESVLLARSCDVSSILKRTMYELVRLAGYGQTNRDVALSTQDLRALVTAREHLTGAWMQTMSPYSQDLMTCASTYAPVAVNGAAPAPAPAPAAPCTTTEPLLSAKAHQKLVHQSGIADDYLYDPLCGLQALVEADWAAEGFCEACVKRRREAWASRRERIWEDLNVWLGL